MKNVFNVVIFFSLIGFGFIMSCKDDTPPTIAEVRVINQLGEPVPYADVVLACTSSINQPCDIEIIAITDKNGVYEHTFDLAKVLTIYAAGNRHDTQITGVLPDTIMTITKDSICGESLISIKPEQTTIQTITLYDCK